MSCRIKAPGPHRGYEAKIQNNWGRLLCWLGMHDDQVIEGTFGFGFGGNVERIICKRCGKSDVKGC